MSFCAVSERWAYGIGRSHHDHLGRTDVRRGLSDRSGGIALTMSLCLASSTFAMCSTHIKNITTKLAHTCHCTRMHRSPAPSRPSVARWPCRFWADCTTNIYECEFPTGTAVRNLPFGRTYKNGCRGMAKSVSKKDTELYLDAWARFERAVDVVAKSPPQHRTKSKMKRK
jgi:hypothetical protein